MEKPATTTAWASLGILKDAAGLIALAVGGLIACVHLQNSVDNDTKAISQIQTQQLDSRIHTLEDEHRSDEQSASDQAQAWQSSVNSIQSELHEMSTTLNTDAQALATLNAQAQFFISQGWPTAKSPLEK